MDVAAIAGQLTLEPTLSTQTLEEAFREHHEWLVRRLTLVVGDPDEAQDLAQQVFVRALEHRPDVDGRALRPWLACVGVNLAISERRRRARWGFLPLRAGERPWVMQVDPDLWRALADLKPQVRTALLLTVLDGFTQEEVASAFGVQRGTVASWLFRARQQLRPVLREVHLDAS